MGLPLVLLFSFAGAETDVSWMSSVAHRMWDVPNPYEFYSAPPPASLLPPEPPPMPEPASERRWFVIEDSGDQMGLPLGPRVVVGLQVEFVGPAEEPAAAQKIIRIPHDPYHPMFLMPTVGMRLQF